MNVTVAVTLSLISCVGTPIPGGGEIDPVRVPVSDNVPLLAPTIVVAATGSPSLKLPAASNSAAIVQAAVVAAPAGASVCLICSWKESVPALSSGSTMLPGGMRNRGGDPAWVVGVPAAVAASAVKVCLMVVSVTKVKLLATGFAWAPGETTICEEMLSLLTHTAADETAFPAEFNGIRCFAGRAAHDEGRGGCAGGARRGNRMSVKIVNRADQPFRRAGRRGRR